MESFELDKIMQESNFPLIEALYSQSSNVKGDTVSSYVVTKVNKRSASERLDALTKLIEFQLSAPVIISGFDRVDSPKRTFPNDVVKNNKRYGKEQKFMVIWLKNECIEWKYHGYAGHNVCKCMGIVLRYPEELCSVA